jgi:catechol 2,3-dioxygenase-like lactoylglutathione lyase family enzyme
MIDGFVHVSISCRDLDRSIQFYETLGLKVTKRLGDVDEPGIGQAFRLPRGHLAVAYLAPSGSAGTMFIDLVQWLEPRSTGETYPVLNNVGLNRIAFRVSDIDVSVMALRQRGISFLSEQPQTIGPGIRCIVTTDPMAFSCS